MISKGQSKGQRVVQGHHPRICMDDCLSPPRSPAPSLLRLRPASVAAENLVCLPFLGYSRMLGTSSAACSIFLPATCAQTFQEPSAGNRGGILLMTLNKPFEIL